jgi:hypothetical protein
MNATPSVEDVKRQFAKDITALEEKARAEGRASASGLSPGAGVAERMAARARQLQAAQPTLTNIEATRLAYLEAGEKLE